MIDPLILQTIELGMALLLLSAAWHKFRSLQYFRDSLRDYALLPEWALLPASILLPATESVLGLCWLMSLATNTAATATASLLAVYSAAIAINVARGRVHIGCGCNGPAGDAVEQPVSVGLIIRNLILIAVALIASAPASSRELGAVDYLILFASLLTALLLYAATNQLLANNSLIRMWRDYRG